MLLTFIRANPSKTIAHLIRGAAITRTSSSPKLSFDRFQSINLKNRPPSCCSYNRTEERRGPRRDGAAVFLRLHLLFVSWKLHSSPHSSLCSGSGSLTAAAADLDGFKLLWLEHPVSVVTVTHERTSAPCSATCGSHTPVSNWICPKMFQTSHKH